MKNIKRLVATALMAAVLATAGAALAAATKTPVEIATDLSGKPAEELYQERAAGKTYGAIAKDAGKLEEFKQQMLEEKQSILDQRVKDGEITQEQADEIYGELERRQAYCDGTGNAAMGREYGTCFGQGSGMGYGRGVGRGGRGGRMGGRMHFGRR